MGPQGTYAGTSCQAHLVTITAEDPIRQCQ